MKTFFETSENGIRIIAKCHIFKFPCDILHFGDNLKEIPNIFYRMNKTLKDKCGIKMLG